MARPTKMTEVTLGKLREAFLLGTTDQEACLYAQINPDTLYEYQKKNKEFSEQKELWKLNPVLKARKTIFDDLDDLVTARWYLERKCTGEFNPRHANESIVDIPALEEIARGVREILDPNHESPFSK